MRLDGRTESLDGRALNGFDLEHSVRVTHGNRAYRDRLTGDVEGVRIPLSRCIKRQFARIEARDTHVNGHHIAAENSRVNESGRAVHRDCAGRCAAATMEQGGYTARAVAALLDLSTIGVEYPVEHCGVGAPRRLQYQRLVEPNAGVPIREAPKLVGAQHGLPGGCIEHEKVVAHAVHLREIKTHGERITETPAAWRLHPVDSTKGSPIPVYAAVHHGENSRCAGPFGGGLVDNAVLEPQCGEF